MKTNLFSYFLATAFSLAAFSTAGCSEKEKSAEASLPSVAKGAAATVPAAADAVKWADIKDCTYDARVQFLAGLQHLEARVDEQINELTAKRAAMKSTTNTKDWDFAMKEMVDARFYLKSTSEEIGKATPETWDQLKDRVGQAWVRTQDAYDKVKSSTTS